LRELPADWVKHIWPNLGLVSCWADGPSATYAANLASQLPGVEIQPKGLLATEGIVTIPLVGHTGGAIAVRSNFFEFLPVPTGGGPLGTDTVLAHEVELHKDYRVVITTAGGLYRYQLNDQVRVVGFQQQLPLLQFVGKADDTMDLVGEKLSAAHAQQVIDHAVQKLGLQPTFIELTAEPTGTPRYTLRVTDGTLAHNAERQLAFGKLVEQGLRSNPGYCYARDLGQLGCLEVLILTQAEADRASDERTADLVRAGMRHGDIKPTLVCRSELLSSQ
jgi:hypothetical protein